MCRCCSHHKRACLNLIRNNGIFRAMQLLHAFDTDHICTCALDIGTHAVQKIGKINDMRFLCRILDNGLTFCHHSSHHDIDGSAY